MIGDSPLLLLFVPNCAFIVTKLYFILFFRTFRQYIV